MGAIEEGEGDILGVFKGLEVRQGSKAECSSSFLLLFV